MINSRRKFIKSLAVGIIGANVLSSIPSSSFARNVEQGIEIQEGYIVLNEETQKTMVALAEALLPGSKKIDIGSKLMNYSYSDRAAATMFDAGIWNLDSLSRSKYNKKFYNLTDTESIDELIKYIKVKNAVFFGHFRYFVFRFYYSDPVVWKRLSYNGPPQTKGFLNYTEAPKIAKTK